MDNVEQGTHQEYKSGLVHNGDEVFKVQERFGIEIDETSLETTKA